MAASSSADLASPGNRAHLTPRVRLKSAQTHVYAAASAQTGLRCGDLVDVEWEATWYPGVVTDIPAPDTLAVSYTNGDFEDSVPQNVARLRDIQPKKKPYQKSHDKRKKHTVNLSDAANAGDIGLVMQALKEGSDPKGVDDFGYTPLHWAAAPDDGMPGDTIARRACITILARLGDVDARDRTHLGLRGVQHSVTRNFVGCVKAFAHVGADMTATVHWGQHCKSHASLRELLRLGVTSPANKDLWEGCTPLMLAAAQNDTYGMQILLDHQEATRGADAVYSFVNAVQAAGSKLRATALHHAADAAADLCTELLLERGARVEARSSRGETALTVAKRRAAAAEKLVRHSNAALRLRALGALSLPFALRSLAAATFASWPSVVAACAHAVCVCACVRVCVLTANARDVRGGGAMRGDPRGRHCHGQGGASKGTRDRRVAAAAPLVRERHGQAQGQGDGQGGDGRRRRARGCERRRALRGNVAARLPLRGNVAARLRLHLGGSHRGGDDGR